MDLHFLLEFCVNSAVKDNSQSALNNGRKNQVALKLEPTIFCMLG